MTARDIKNMSVDELADEFYRKFNAYAADLKPKVDYSRDYCRHLAVLAIRVRAIAEEKGELLLAHYYQRPEVQEVADFVGDSLGLGLEAKKILELSPDDLQKKLGRKNSVTRVRMSAVRFMGDTVKIILGDRMRVFMPRFSGCSLVASLHGMRRMDFSKMSAEDVSRWLMNHTPAKDAIDSWKEQNPDGIVLSYMNSTPEAKAKSFAVFTSRNGLKVLEYAMRENPGKRVLMLPDKHLSAIFLGMAAKQTNEWIRGDLLDPFDGACHVHEQKISRHALDEAMERYPDAVLLVHPECGCAVECMARVSSGKMNRESYFFSTQEMIWHAAKEKSGNEFIVATESGMLYTLRKNVPHKTFYPVTEDAVCEFMKATTLENLLESMESDDDSRYEVTLDEDVRLNAWDAIERMLGIV